MRQDNALKMIIGLYSATVIYWLAVFVIAQYSLVGESLLHFLRLSTEIPLTIIPLTGGILGLRNAVLWGGIKSMMGRSSLFLSLGLLAWGIGNIVWTYYIFFTATEVPYPSFADFGYILSPLFFLFGIRGLFRVVGAHFSLRSAKGKLLIFIIPLLVILISVYLLIYVARGGVLVHDSGSYIKLFFDLLYPLSDIAILTMISLIYFLSRDFLGGRYKAPILIIFFGFVLFYASDFSFSYTTTIGTFYNGSFTDFLFTTTMFIISMGIVMLSPKRINAES